MSTQRFAQTCAAWTFVTICFAGCGETSSTPDPELADPGERVQVPVPTDDGGIPADAAKDDAQLKVDPGVELPYGVLDRAGRPLVSQLLTSESNRDYFNSEPFFALPDAGSGTTLLGEDFQSRLVTLDLLDGVDDWNGGEKSSAPDTATGLYPHPLTDAWLVDAIMVDPEQPFSKTGYLDLERHYGSNATCGGRWFSDDAIDKTLSFLVTGEVTGVSDGVSAATKAPTLTFPYLASPN